MQRKSKLEFITQDPYGTNELTSRVGLCCGTCAKGLSISITWFTVEEMGHVDELDPGQCGLVSLYPKAKVMWSG